MIRILVLGALALLASPALAETVYVPADCAWNVKAQITPVTAEPGSTISAERVDGDVTIDLRQGFVEAGLCRFAISDAFTGAIGAASDFSRSSVLIASDAGSTLTGLSRFGKDMLVGGADDDTLTVNAVGSVIQPGAGRDTWIVPQPVVTGYPVNPRTRRRYTAKQAAASGIPPITRDAARYAKPGDILIRR